MNILNNPANANRSIMKIGRRKRTKIAPIINVLIRIISFSAAVSFTYSISSFAQVIVWENRSFTSSVIFDFISKFWREKFEKEGVDTTPSYCLNERS